MNILKALLLVGLALTVAACSRTGGFPTTRTAFPAPQTTVLPDFETPQPTEVQPIQQARLDPGSYSYLDAGALGQLSSASAARKATPSSMLSSSAARRAAQLERFGRQRAGLGRPLCPRQQPRLPRILPSRDNQRPDLHQVGHCLSRGGWRLERGQRLIPRRIA